MNALDLVFSFQAIAVDRILLPIKQTTDDERSVLLHDPGILLLRQDEKYIRQIFLSQFISERRFLQFDLMQKTYRLFIEILLRQLPVGSPPVDLVLLRTGKQRKTCQDRYCITARIFQFFVIDFKYNDLT